MDFTKDGIELAINESEDIFGLLASAARKVEEADEALVEELENAERGSLYQKLGLTDSPHVDEAWKQEQRQKAVELFGATRVVLDPETSDTTIPWDMAPRLRKLAVHVLANAEKYLLYVDGTCGGYYYPRGVKVAFENMGRLTGALAVQANFTGYQYSNPYEW